MASGTHLSDTKISRQNMVLGQIAPSPISSRSLSFAFDSIPRENYIPGPYKHLSYTDEDIWVDNHWFWSPEMTARLIVSLNPSPHHKALILDAGLGYSGVLLSSLIAGPVVLQESNPDLQKEGKSLLSDSMFHWLENDALQSLSVYAPYDLILIEAPRESPPQSALNCLKDGGRLVYVLAKKNMGYIILVEKKKNDYVTQTLFEKNLQPCLNETPVFELDTYD